MQVKNNRTASPAEACQKSLVKPLKFLKRLLSVSWRVFQHDPSTIEIAIFRGTGYGARTLRLPLPAKAVRSMPEPARAMPPRPEKRGTYRDSGNQFVSVFHRAQTDLDLNRNAVLLQSVR